MEPHMTDIRPPPTDQEFLAAVDALARCLSGGQDARLSRAELERLTLLARLGMRKA